MSDRLTLHCSVGWSRHGGRSRLTTEGTPRRLADRSVEMHDTCIAFSLMHVAPKLGSISRAGLKGLGCVRHADHLDGQKGDGGVAGTRPDLNSGGTSRIPVQPRPTRLKGVRSVNVQTMAVTRGVYTALEIYVLQATRTACSTLQDDGLPDSRTMPQANKEPVASGDVRSHSEPMQATLLPLDSLYSSLRPNACTWQIGAHQT
jgi:hypothetical protein